MNQTVLSLIVGLIAGAGGALAVTAMRGHDGTQGGSLEDGPDLGSVIARLERLEAQADRPDLRGAPGLEGRDDAHAASAAARLDALAARLEERLKPVVEKTAADTAKQMIKEEAEKLPPLLEGHEPHVRKTATLAEAAAEIGLSAEQEESARRIARETSEAFFKLVADKDNPAADIQREFEEARGDKTKRKALAAKYMPKALNKLGSVMAVIMGHEQKMNVALGEDKWAKLESDYEIAELDPYGIADVLDFD